MQNNDNDNGDCRAAHSHLRLSELSFRLRSAERLNGRDERQTSHRLGFSHALIVVTGGDVGLNLERTQIRLAGGSVYWLRPETTFGFDSANEEYELYLFHFIAYRFADDDGRQPAEVYWLDSFRGQSFAPAFERLSSLCAAVWRSWSDAFEPRAAFRCQIDFQELLYELLFDFRTQPASSSAALEYARRHMEEHYGEELTIDRLAGIAGLSPKYFVELFKKRYGVSAMEYVAELRMREAKKLMAQPGLKLRDIAHRVGYSDEFYFSRKFKKELGVSPAAYRKNRRRKLAVYDPELLGMLLPLDVMPVAAPLHPKWTEYYYRELRSEIPVHLSANRHSLPRRANLDLLRQLSAELIVAWDASDGGEREELERLAPVCYLGSPEADWRESFCKLAGLLGEERQADVWLERYERLLLHGRERVRERIGEQSVAIVRLTGRRLSLHCNQSMSEVLFRGLGLTAAYRNEAETYDVPVTPEELSALNADRLLLLIRQESATLEAWRRLQRDSRWQAIEAVRSERAQALTSDPWRERSAHAHLRMAEQALRLLADQSP